MAVRVTSVISRGGRRADGVNDGFLPFSSWKGNRAPATHAMYALLRPVLLLAVIYS